MQIFSLPALDYLRLRFHLAAQKDCDLPTWKGSLLRGAFGHALRCTVCTMKKGQLCEDCMLRPQCAYTRLFETFITSPPPRFLRGQVSSPRPFIFEPHDKNRNYRTGDTLWFDLILIGEAINFLPYVVFAVFQMGQSGLGASRHPFVLETAYCVQPGNENASEVKEQCESIQSDGHNWQVLYEGATQRILFTPEPMELGNSSSPTNASSLITLKFLTPTRIKFKNELIMDFTFRMLVFKMLRRVLELAYFYSPQAEINWEFHDLLVAADDINITQRNLRWEDWERYSNRQKSKMKLGGFVGDIVLEGDLSPFLELLSYSEVLHVGKGATFGLGRVGIQ